MECRKKTVSNNLTIPDINKIVQKAVVANCTRLETCGCPNCRHQLESWQLWAVSDAPQGEMVTANGLAQRTNESRPVVCLSCQRKYTGPRCPFCGKEKP